MKFRPTNPFATMMEYTPNSGIQALKDWLEESPANVQESNPDFIRGFSHARTKVAEIVCNIGESISGRIIDGLEADVEEMQNRLQSILNGIVRVDSALHIAHEHFTQPEIIRAKIATGVKLDESDLEYINVHLK